MDRAVLKAALGYAKRGWQVIPVRGKIPTTPNGLKDAVGTAKDIRKLFHKYPGDGVAVVTGKVSNLVVLDVDAKHNAEKLLLKLGEKYGQDFKKTFTVKTGGRGYHFFYSHPGGKIGNRAGTLDGEGFDGVDFRGDGGYVVAPPSRHAVTKRRYKVIRSHDNAPCPSWLKEWASDDGTSATRKASSDVVVGEGQRDNYLFRMGSALRRKGASEEAIFQGMWAENQARCEPPLSKQDVRRIAGSSAKYVPTGVKDAIVTSQDTYTKASDLYASMAAFLSDEEKVKGVSTMIPWLDQALGGGRRRGEIIGWHAIAKAGKSSWLHYMMAQMLEAGIPIGYASREMDPAEEVLPNILSVVTGRNAWKSKLDKKSERMVSEWPLYFAKGYGYFSAEDFKSWALSLKEHEGVQFFFLDHLLYAMEDPEDYKEVSRFCRDTKAFVREHGICLDMVIQPRYLQQGERLTMNTMRGGSAISQAIDNLFIMERLKGHPNFMQLKFEIGRSKLCEVGSEAFFKYNKKTTGFEEVDPVIEEEKDDE